MLAQLVFLPSQSSRLVSASPQEIASSGITLSLPGKELTEWVLDETSGNIYALAREANQLLFIRYSDLTLLKTIDIGSVPTDLVIDQGKIYVGLGGAHQIKVVDIATGTIEKTLATGRTVNRLSKDNQYIYYLSSSDYAVMKYDLNAGTESAIAPPGGGSFNFTDLEVNIEKNLLYLAGSDFMALDLGDNSRVVSRINANGYNFGKPVIAQGDDVYYGSRRLDATNLELVKGTYTAFTDYHFDKLLQVRDQVVVTSRHIYDKETYRVLANLANFPNESSLALMDSNQNVYIFSYQTISKTKIELPALSYDGHTPSVNQLDLRSPITQWVSDNNHIYALSTENTLLTINKDTMTVDKESYIGSKPVDLDLYNGSLYIANNGSSSIGIVNAADSTVSAAAQLSARMPLQAAAYEDKLFFTSTNIARSNNTLSVYSSVTQSVYEIKNGYFDIDANHIVISPEKGMLYASDDNNMYGIELQHPYKVHNLVNGFGYSTRTLFIDGDAIYAGTKKYSTDQPAQLLATFPDQAIYAKGAYVFTQNAVYDSNSSAKLFDLPFEVGLVDMDASGSVYLVRGNKDPFFTETSGMNQVYKFNSIEDVSHYMDTFTPGESVFLDTNDEAGLVSGFVVFEPAGNDADVDHYTLFFMNEDKQRGQIIGEVYKEDLDNGLYYYNLYGRYPQADQTHIAIFANIKANNNGRYRQSTAYSRTRLWDMPTFLADSITFNDTDSNPNTIGGALSWLPASKEMAGSVYEVYFAGADGIIGSRIASVNTKQAAYQITIPSGTPIPDQALTLAVLYTDNEGETAPYYSITPVLDRITRTPVLEDIKVTNRAGTVNDSITVSQLQAGETVRIYSDEGELLNTATLPPGRSELTINVTHLNAGGGSIYLTLQAPGKAESLVFTKAYLNEYIDNSNGGNGGGTGGGPVGGGGGFGGFGGIIPSPSNDKVTSTNGQLTLPAGKSGEVSVDEGLTVSIPANATNKELKLTIEKVANTQNFITNQEVLVSSIYEILKDFTENFNNPVTLTFVFNPASLKDNQRAVVFYYDETKKTWVEVPGGKINGNKISVDVNHFTKYAVLAVDKPKTVPDKAVPSFSDISGYWAEANIKLAVSNGIVSGYPDGTFKPKSTVTRAEFAVMLMNTLKPQAEATAPLTFTDSAKIGAWAQDAVAQAVQAGYIKGYEDGTFRPSAEITRAEMAAILAKVLGQPAEEAAGTSFADDTDIPKWARSSVALVQQQGIIQGKSNNRFAPDDHATRAEAVTVLLKVLDQKSK
ncbi:hypothetical protein GCM10010911_57520 [Paenibacillus nasutitermitis]|uniref:SLH domain-containing protein n=2 Tax=Paenibacillus nasutitermitis TaxID=1652958 RepID=A0A916ZE40_9BACL|nr:hypothetical protein GCM10010911_57520 [Paenibacillus nasutitermitis]